MSTVELETAPPLGPIFRRAALGVLSRRSGAGLPDTTLVLRGVRVDVDHLARYARVCGFPLTGALPATYPHVLAFPLTMTLLTDPGFPFPVIGSVHVANQITVSGPLTAESTMDFEVRAENLRDHERGRQLDLVAVATVDGREAWRAVSTYLRKEKSSQSERRDQIEPPPASAHWRVTPTVAKEYAEVSGDRNPIHTSRLGARLFGFPKVIAHGMWSKARCLAALDGRLPDQYTVDVSFKTPVLLPSTVAFSATAQAPGWTFALHHARSGKPHLAGTIRAD